MLESQHEITTKNFQLCPFGASVHYITIQYIQFLYSDNCRCGSESPPDTQMDTPKGSVLCRMRNTECGISKTCNSRNYWCPTFRILHVVKIPHSTLCKKHWNKHNDGDGQHGRWRRRWAFVVVVGHCPSSSSMSSGIVVVGCLTVVVHSLQLKKGK